MVMFVIDSNDYGGYYQWKFSIECNRGIVIPERCLSLLIYKII